MGEVVKLERKVREDFTPAVGMAVALAAFGMMFAGLFFVYAGLRVRSDFWPPPGMPRPPLLLPSANTLVMLVSSGTLVHALRRGRLGDGRGMAQWLGLTVGLGVAFVALQLLLWRQMMAMGVTMASGGAFASVLYVLTVLHALHVAAGVVVLVRLYLRARRTTAARDTTGLRAGAMFWHFVDLVWVAMFLSMFVF
ncbi:MAG: cytochrome c oxidase subunit 3 [Myxococcales bacterium]|nr:cytochrome c oxidase subunit 3 [Myxococcales bacterium]